MSNTKTIHDWQTQDQSAEYQYTGYPGFKKKKSEIMRKIKDVL